MNAASIVDAVRLAHTDDEFPVLRLESRVLRTSDFLGEIATRAAEIDRTCPPGPLAIAGDDPLDLILACLATRASGRIAAIAGREAVVADRLGVLRGDEAIVLGETSIIVPHSPPPSLPHDVGFALLTSGSTGLPRWTLRSDASLIEEGERYRLVFDLLTGQRILVGVPLYHAFAFGLALGSMAVAGIGLNLTRKFIPRRVAEAIATDGDHLVTLVPAAARLVCSAARSAGIRKQISGRIVIGAGPVSEQLDRDLLDQFGVVAARNYGSSEMGAVLGSSGEHVPAGATGRRFPRVEFRIVGQDDEGVLFIRTPAPFSGYLTENGFDPRRISPDGWFCSEDRCNESTDGWITVTGRMGTALRRGGRSIEPAEIERALRMHASVAECAVIGHPTDDGEMTIEAYLTVQEGITTNADELRAHLASRLESYKIPSVFHIRAELPRTAGGKIDRSQLVDDRLRKVDVPVRTEEKIDDWIKHRRLAAAAALAVIRERDGTLPPADPQGLSLLQTAERDGFSSDSVDALERDVFSYESWLLCHAMAPEALVARLRGSPPPQMDVGAANAYRRLMARASRNAADLLVKELAPVASILEIGVPAGAFVANARRAWGQKVSGTTIDLLKQIPGEVGLSSTGPVELVVLHNVVRRGGDDLHSLLQRALDLLTPTGVLAISDVIQPPIPTEADRRRMSLLSFEWWAMGQRTFTQTEAVVRHLGLKNMIIRANHSVDRIFRLVLLGRKNEP